MLSVKRREEIPSETLIAAYQSDDILERRETHLDCYTVELERTVDLREFIEAFYTTLPFRAERRVLAFVAKRPSTDDQATALALGELEEFAAWTVEARNASEILMCDMDDKTRSWLMVEAAGTGTRLYFGSVVTPSRHPETGKPSLGWVFRAFMPIHGIYSRILLASARARLARAR